MTTLDGFVAGDTATLRLTITPDGGVPTDATTTAAVSLVDPAGQTRAPAAFPNDDRSQWSATLDELQAGEYVGRWTVTGTGEGVEAVRVLVAPAPAAVDAGRAYATSADLAAYLHAAPPAGSRLLLERATARVDELLVAAVYQTDEDGMPVDTALAAVLRDATCAMAAWLDETGDTTGSGAAAGWSDVSIGSVHLGGASRTVEPLDPRYAPNAVRILRTAGLLDGRPWVMW